MKKFTFFAVALASLFLAGSCQQENLEPTAAAETVTITVELPQQQTKAIGDAETVTELIYEVWNTDSNGNLVGEQLTHRSVDLSGTTYDLSLDLLNDHNYAILFWAQVKDAGHYVTTNLTEVKEKKTQFSANQESRAAFYGVYTIEDHNRKATGTVTLRRPFAQLNLGTEIKGQSYNVPLELSASAVTVANVANQFNVLTGIASGDQEITFASYSVPGANEVFPIEADKYHYAGMNYFFVPKDGTNITVNYTITTNHGDVTNEVLSVPVKQNFRTNLYGNLLTSNALVKVEISDEWDGANNLEVVVDGLVKNVDGDYEISSANGLAYALEYLFAEGGDFYILKSIDMTGVDYTTPDIPVGKTLNVYGKELVKTRSAESFGPVTITGLTKPLIGKVEGTLSVSGLNLADTGSVLIDEVAEEATVVVENCEASKIVATGNVVDASGITDLAALKTALASGVNNITLASDITSSEIIVISKNVVLDGNDKTITSTAARAINVSGADEVTIKNLNIKASGERAINVIQNTKKVLIDNVNAIASNYTVNVAASAPAAEVTILDSEFTGLNAINIAAPEVIVNLTGSKITCDDQNDLEGYAAIAIPFEAINATVTATDCTIIVNGDSSAGSYSAEGSSINLVNTEGVVKKKSFVIVYGNYNYAFETLSDVFEKVSDNETIIVTQDVELDKSATLAKGKSVILDLNGKTITGTDNTEKNFELIKNQGTLTIKNTSENPAKMTLKATINSGWNRYSAVIANTVGGNLTIEGNIVLEHLGGTDMAYGIDNLTNGKGTYAVTTINGATVKSPYRAVRQFLNGIEATNELHVKAGSVLEGVNKSIFFHDPSAKANTGKLVVEEGAQLNGDVYLYVTAGSTEWPVEVSIADSAVGEYAVLSANVPSGLAVAKIDGVWQIVENAISTVEELVAFANEVNENKNSFSGKTVYLMADLDLKDIDWEPIGQTGNCTFNGVFEGNNHTISNLSVDSEEETGANYSSGLFGWIEAHTWDGKHGVVKNLTIDGATINGHHNCAVVAGYLIGSVENCHVKNAEVNCTVANDEANGDKAGSIAGILAEANAFIKDCSATTVIIKAGRDAGQIVGAALNGWDKHVTGCTATDVTVEANGTGTGKNIRNELVGRL